MKICVPSLLPGGTMAHVFSGFADAPCFTVITIHPDGTKGVEIIQNYGQGDAALPARLMSAGVSVLVVSSIGPGYLELLWNCSIRVYMGAVGTVDDTVNEYRNGFLAEASVDDVG